MDVYIHTHTYIHTLLKITISLLTLICRSSLTLFLANDTMTLPPGLRQRHASRSTSRGLTRNSMALAITT